MDCVLLSLLLLFLLLPFLATNLLNLFTCLFLMLINVVSLTFFMNSMHLSLPVVVVSNDNSLDLHLSSLPSLSPSMTLIHLTLSYSSCFPALCVICLALLLILMLVDLSLRLTSTIPLLIHLKVNLL